MRTANLHVTNGVIKHPAHSQFVEAVTAAGDAAGFKVQHAGTCHDLGSAVDREVFVEGQDLSIFAAGTDPCGPDTQSMIADALTTFRNRRVIIGNHRNDGGDGDNQLSQLADQHPNLLVVDVPEDGFDSDALRAEIAAFLAQASGQTEEQSTSAERRGGGSILA